MIAAFLALIACELVRNAFDLPIPGPVLGALVQTLDKSAAVALRQNRSHAARTAFQISGVVLLSLRSLPRLN